MIDKNRLDKIKDAAAESLKTPASVANSVVDLAKGAATAGLTAGGSIAKAASDTASHLASSLKGAKDHVDPEPPRSKASPSRHDVDEAPSQPEPGVSTTDESTGKPKPVNVTRELGLDPSPVAKRKPAKTPITKIDRDADERDVRATPADVAKVVDGGPDGETTTDQ